MNPNGPKFLTPGSKVRDRASPSGPQPRRATRDRATARCWKLWYTQDIVISLSSSQRVVLSCLCLSSKLLGDPYFLGHLSGHVIYGRNGPIRPDGRITDHIWCRQSNTRAPRATRDGGSNGPICARARPVVVELYMDPDSNVLVFGVARYSAWPVSLMYDLSGNYEESINICPKWFYFPNLEI